MTMIVTAPGVGKGTKITLHWSEVLTAASVGVLRKVLHMREDGGKKCWVDTPDKWWREIEGCCGELALSKMLDIPWKGMAVGFDAKEREELKRYDVGRYQVRTTEHAGGHLLVDRDENPKDVFILLVGESPSFKVVGWLFGREAQLDKYWETQKLKHPAYMVPQNILHGMETLPVEF